MIKLTVFLCHSSSDKPTVRALYNKLRADGVAPWLDEIDILPGRNWGEEIPEAVRRSDAIIVCLSRQSVNKEGYVQKEISVALDVADEKPEGTIFIIPLMLEECQAPRKLQRWQWVNLYQDGGYGRLMLALQERARSLGRVIGGANKFDQHPEKIDPPHPPITAPWLIEVQQYKWYKHPTLNYEIDLDKWRLGVHGPENDYFDVRSLPQSILGKKWVRLQSQNKQELPLKVCWNKGRLLVEWLL